MPTHLRPSCLSACQVVILQHYSWSYKAHRRDNIYGNWRKCVPLWLLVPIHVAKREGWVDNHKHVHRLHCLEGLNYRGKLPKRSRAAAHRL